MENFYKKCLWIVTVAAFLSSCSSPAQREFAEKREIWRSKQIPNYRYTIMWSTYPFTDYTDQPATIEVRGGQNVLIDCAKCKVRDQPFFLRFNSVEDLFSEAKIAIDKNAKKVEVKYDENFGFPVEVHVDETDRMHDEWSFKISNFETLE